MTDTQAAISPRTGTRRGRAAALPVGHYDVAERVCELPDGFKVTVVGEDGRRRTFNLTTLPLPGWHRHIANAFAASTGPQGSLRTATSAAATLWNFRNLMTALASLSDPPSTLPELTVAHMKQYWLQRQAAVKQRTLHHELWAVRKLFTYLPPDTVAEDVWTWLHRRLPAGDVPSLPGYSDREFQAIMSAARSEVSAIRMRLKQGRRMLERWQHDPQDMTALERELAATLASIAATGKVPQMGWARQSWDDHPMMQLARHLFVTDFDLGPLLVLAVGLSGRNAETIKDLLAEHDVLEGKALSVTLTKRRRGPRRMFETVHWEIGSASQQLQRPGGFYLLLDDLMRPGRAFSKTPSLWSSWNPRQGHYGPFDEALHLKDWHMSRWKKRHKLLDDNGAPLRITLPRLKKTVDIRNTRAAGGHLPSSTRSNTMPVLFTSYLRGDPSVRDWAGGVITEALSDAEKEAKDVYAQIFLTTVIAADESGQEVLGSDAAASLAAGGLDTAFAACSDFEHSPHNGGHRCNVSFLLCFGCPNALITAHHIPRLKGLLDWMVRQRDTEDSDRWWRRYGQAWLAITDHIRPKFTPAEWDAAEPSSEVDQLMSLLDGPRES